jgi:hypothetical protein
MKSSGSARMGAAKLVAGALAALSGSACVAMTSSSSAATSPELAALQATWRAAISQTPAPRGGGCFTAHYPSTAWSKVSCVTAPNTPLIPKTGHNSGALTVGDGDDYAISTQTLISTGVGSFPKVKGLKTETGEGQANAYTLQLNSEFFNGPVCAGAQTPSKCLTWLQYVYFAAKGQSSVFMQYWLINWDKTCPAGWNSFSPDCYKNSAAVGAPQEPITDLSQMSITGSAVNGGVDTAVFMDGANAYTTTGPDTVVDLAGYWNGSEFNIIGPGDGSEANFNSGTKLTVEIAVNDGSTAAPACLSDAGTTGETNNLNLGKCKTKAGDTPSISFKESN